MCDWLFQQYGGHIDHIPFTRTCPAKETGRSGAGGEGGTVIQGVVVLVWQSSGMPIDLTRAVPVAGIKMAEIHGVGPGPAGGGTVIGQPATINGAADMGIGVPMIFTLGFGAVGFA